MYAVCLRTVFNRAKREFNDEDAGVINIPRSPFEGMERPMSARMGAAAKRSVGTVELLRVLGLERRSGWAKGRRDFNLALDCFRLSFLLLGMNAADLYECSRYVDGRIIYNRRKTRRVRVDGAEMSVLVPQEAAGLVGAYRDAGGERVFDFHRRYKTYRSFYNAVARGMRLVAEAAAVPGLQFYSARHTWATIAANEAGVDRYTVHQALNHADRELRATEVYIRRDWSVLDAANRRVLDYLGAVRWLLDFSAAVGRLCELCGVRGAQSRHRE